MELIAVDKLSYKWKIIDGEGLKPENQACRGDPYPFARRQYSRERGQAASPWLRVPSNGDHRESCSSSQRLRMDESVLPGICLARPIQSRGPRSAQIRKHRVQDVSFCHTRGRLYKHPMLHRGLTFDPSLNDGIFLLCKRIQAMGKKLLHVLFKRKSE